jgi:hypothetical protein
MIRNFTTGNNRTKNRLNEIVNVANKVSTVSQSVKRETINRFPYLREGGGSGIRIAYCGANAAGNVTAYMPCYFDEARVGEQIFVKFMMFGTSQLAQCFPLLTTGTPILVTMIDAQWTCIWPLYAWEECVSG